MPEDVLFILLAAAAFWALLILFTALRPQRLFNSFLLMVAILFTLIAIAACFEDYKGYVLLGVAIAVFVALLLCPVLLIWNGIIMMKKERRSVANMLSLLLGIFIAIGEAAMLSWVIQAVFMNSYVRIRFLSLKVWISLSVFYISAIMLCFVVYMLFIQILPHSRNLNYIIIHGSGLINGKEVPKLLANRIDKAIEVFEKTRRNAFIIPSGGMGPGEEITEAEAIKTYLLEKGMPEDHILLEGKSKNTRENLLFSKELIDERGGKKKTALVTSNYHVYRCLCLAKELGMKCTGIGAKVASYYWPSAVIREFAAVFTQRRYLILTIIGYIVFVLGPVFVLISNGQ
jgi:uncharacterized SAM-binding protein YcdF (DUF218 family)